MTDRKLLKLALDALINAVPCTAEQIEEQRNAIEALQEAIAHPALPVAFRSLQPSGSYTYCNTPQFFNNAEPVYL